MKGPYTALFVLAALTGQAQRQLPELPQDRDSYHTPARSMPTSGDRGSAFYTESFDTDLNGWTVLTTAGAVNWKWTSIGPGPTASTYPVPVLNTSTPSGWAIIDDDHDGVTGVATNSSLISPVIDLSGAPVDLKVEFDQYFQEFQLDQTFVGVSTDGGVTWNETEINIGVGRDGRPNPELVDVNISAWVAADPNNVQLRFRYQSTWDYGWQVDNIAIRELPANDMALVRAKNTAFDYENTEFNYMDYSVYPVSQVVELNPSTTLKNKGSNTQTGVRSSLVVDGPGGNELNNQTNPATYVPGEEVTVPSPAYTPSGALGDYTMTYTISQDQTDDVPSNNTVMNRFSVSQNVFAHDDGVVDNYQIQGADNLSEGFEVGNYFVLQQQAYLTAIQVALHEDTPVGGTVYGAVYFPSGAATEHPDLIELTSTVTITQAHLNTIGGSTFITIPFSTPVQLDGAQPYFVVAGSFDGPDNVHFATSGVSDPQVSNIHYPSLTADFQFFITRTPMVRMVISANVGTEDLISNGTVLGGNLPNPFSDVTRIPFTLEASMAVSLVVSDVTGKTVVQQDLGTRAAGNQSVVFDATQLAAGVYTYTLVAGGDRWSRRMVVSK